MGLEVDETSADNSIKIEYSNRYAAFKNAENSLSLSDLIDCQTYDAECQAIKEAKNTYQNIYDYLLEVNNALKTARDSLETVNTSLGSHMAGTIAYVGENSGGENGKIGIKETLENLVEAMETNSINKFETILSNLESNLNKMDTDYNTRKALYDELYTKIKSSVATCRRKYTLANTYYWNNKAVLTNDWTNMYYDVYYSTNTYDFLNYVDAKEGEGNE